MNCTVEKVTNGAVPSHASKKMTTIDMSIAATVQNARTVKRFLKCAECGKPRFFSMLKHPNVVLVYVVVLLGPSKIGIVMECPDNTLCSYCGKEKGMGTRNNQSLMNDRVTEKTLLGHRF